MKLFKLLLVFVIVGALCVSAWFYYPQYLIERMKKQAIETTTDVQKTSYINYFQDSTEQQIDHLAIGDSVIRGYGANHDESLVHQFSSQLEENTGKSVHLQNEGINGITSGELNSIVQAGQFDQQFKYADIITINVGGNDVLRMAKKQDYYRAFQEFEQLQSNFSENLNSIVAHIDKLNPNAAIVLLELYNPLHPDNQVYSLAEKLLPKWNVKIYEVAKQNPNAIVVETTKVINGKNLHHLSADGVHPNSDGYAAISSQILYQFTNQYIQKAV